MTVTLEFLAEQQNQIITEMRALRATLAAILDELRALHAQHARFDHRLRQMEPPL